MTEPTKQDAEAMLEEAGGIRLAVQARAPEEHVPILAWGLVVAFFGPIRDLGDDSVLGGILLWVALVALAVAAVMLVTYLRRSRQVRVRPRTPNWLALAFGAWAVAAAHLLPGLVDGAISFAYSAGGILGAAPLLWWAERLRKTA